MKIPVQQLLWVSGLMSAVLTLGTLGFRWVEGWGLFDSFYMALITLTTVGYGDFSPATGAGRVFTIFYVLIGLGVIIALVTQIASKAVEAQTERIEQRQEKRKGTE